MKRSKGKASEWYIMHEMESNEGYAYEKPSATPLDNETHVIEYSAYQKLVTALKHINNRDLSCGPCSGRSEYEVSEHLSSIARAALKEAGEI